MTTPKPLTPDQAEALAAVRRYKDRERCGATVAEIAEACGRVRYWARDKLVALERRKLVFREGYCCGRGGTCWHPDPRARDIA